MICFYCCDAADFDMPEQHKQCKGGTHCDCQHYPRTPVGEAVVAEGQKD
jgi:hypothetical protein